MTSPSDAPRVPADLAPRIAGALFDFLGYATTRTDAVTLGASHNASPAVALLLAWAKDRGLATDGALVNGWDADPTAAEDSISVKVARHRLATFGALILNRYTDAAFGWGDLDGGNVQELAVRAGALVPKVRTVPCGDGCACYEAASGDETVCMTTPRTVRDLAEALTTTPPR